MSILKLRKRLFRNNGSVLFIVLVVMSMLIIAATVTYYIVNNQNASVEVHYASEQSYQTARSLLDTVDRFLTKQFDAMAASGDSLKPYKNTLAGRMINMGVDTTIDTTPIDLKDMGLGDATLSIKRVNGRPSDDPDTLNQYYEVTVNAEVNGESTSLTQVRMVQVGVSTYFTRFLTCTGKRGEDVRIGAGDIYGDAYFENEYTEWYSGAPDKLNKSLYSSGTLMDKGIQYQRPTDNSYMEAVVKENYIVGTTYGSKVDVPYLFVGNDFYNDPSPSWEDAGKEITCDAVYVVKDYYKYANQDDHSNLFIGGDCHIESGTSNSTFYVNKDLYLFDEASGGISSQGTFYVNGNVYVGQSAKDGAGQFTNVYYSGSLIDAATGAVIPSLTNFHQDGTVGTTITAALTASNPVANLQSFTGGVNSVEDYIRSKTAKNKYKKWKAEKFFDDNLRAGAQTITVDTQYAPVTTTSNAVILNSMEVSQSKLVVDATAGDVYIYLNGVVGADGKKTFNVAALSEIIVKGQNAVVLILPEDTNFKMKDQTIIGNSALLEKCSNNSSFDASYFETDCNGHLSGISTTKANALMHVEGDVNTVGGYQIPADDSVIKINETTAPGASNSIFLVTTGNSNVIDLDGQCLLTGYMYAPKSRMTSNGISGNLEVVGGMIVGSYSYQNPSTGLVFAQPYDYKNGNSDIVTRLISQANSSSSTPDPEDDTVFKGASVIGYK